MRIGSTVAALQSSHQHRDLKSDVLLVHPEGLGDTSSSGRLRGGRQTVRDRTILAKLFLNPTASSAEQLEQIQGQCALQHRRHLEDERACLRVGLPASGKPVAVEVHVASRVTGSRRTSTTVRWPGSVLRTTGGRISRARFRVDAASGRVLMSGSSQTPRFALISVTYQLDRLSDLVRQMRSFTTSRRRTPSPAGRRAGARRFNVAATKHSRSARRRRGPPACREMCPPRGQPPRSLKAQAISAHEAGTILKGREAL
jgi:hypothetical protein